MHKQGIVVGSLSVALAAALSADARPEMDFIGDFEPQMQSPLLHVPFAMLDVPLGGTRAPKPDGRSASLSGSTIAALTDGALVIDGDSGKLLRLDKAGVVTARLTIGNHAPQLVVDREHNTAFIADREGDRVVVATIGAGLEETSSIATRTEPFGLALTPDGATLLVTTVADRNLTAYDAKSGTELWSIDVGPEPRGVAISPSGDEAIVTLLTTGAVARVRLEDQRVKFVALNPTKPAATNRFGGFSVPANIDDNSGRSFARGAFTATYIGNDLAIVPHQISTPHQAVGHNEIQSSYGGGGSFNPPIAHRVTFIGADGPDIAVAHIGTHQPRAAAYDDKTDTLYIAGFGSEQVLALSDASQASVGQKWLSVVNDATASCGPNGLALTDDGALLVYCSLSQKVATVRQSNTNPLVADVSFGNALTTSKLSDAQKRGRAMFRQGLNAQMSTLGAMACTSCHPEGRTDGLSWRIEGKTLQTPLLAGRLAGTHPFKWDGADKTLDESLTNTVRRLGGTGITAEQAADLKEFVESLPKPRTPTVDNASAVARGEKLFESDATGCATCHSGALFTNGKSYDLADDLDKVDTPSLIGLAYSAPYYHDGSAGTLRSVLLETGKVHGMGKTDSLNERDIDDLISYLKTL